MWKKFHGANRSHELTYPQLVTGLLRHGGLQLPDRVLRPIFDKYANGKETMDYAAFSKGLLNAQELGTGLDSATDAGAIKMQRAAASQRAIQHDVDEHGYDGKDVEQVIRDHLSVRWQP